MSKTALIVYPHRTIASNPTMVAVIQELLARRVEVRLMMPSAASLDRSALFDQGAAITAIELDHSHWEPPLKERFPRRVLRAWRPRTVPDVRTRAVQAGGYDVVLGVDPSGIDTAASINTVHDRPMAYLSFELLLDKETESDYEITLKARERAASAKCGLFLIQDEQRRELFCRDNGVDPSLCSLVPVAPRYACPKKTNYLRERLGIGGDRMIVLYSGSLHDWSCWHEFEELVSYWGPDYCLVIHSRDRPGKRMAGFLRRMTAGGSIYVTSGPVSPSELPVLTASADFGLATYRPNPARWETGDNIRHLGLASGKLSYYAMCGLPVLARHLPCVDRLLEQHGFGLSYRRLADSGALLENMRKHREAMSKAALQFYEDKLNPARPVGEFCDRLMALSTLGSPSDGVGQVG